MPWKCIIRHTHSSTQTDASLHFNAVFCCMCPWALISLCSVHPQQREGEGEKKLIFIIFMLSRTLQYPLCLRESLSARQTCAEMPLWVQKHVPTLAFTSLAIQLRHSTKEKMEQVALPQCVAQGHVKQDTWLVVETGCCGDKACSCQPGHASPG